MKSAAPHQPQQGLVEWLNERRPNTTDRNSVLDSSLAPSNNANSSLTVPPRAHSPSGRVLISPHHHYPSANREKRGDINEDNIGPPGIPRRSTFPNQIGATHGDGPNGASHRHRKPVAERGGTHAKTLSGEKTPPCSFSVILLVSINAALCLALLSVALNFVQWNFFQTVRDNGLETSIRTFAAKIPIQVNVRGIGVLQESMSSAAQFISEMQQRQTFPFSQMFPAEYVPWLGNATRNNTNTSAASSGSVPVLCGNWTGSSSSSSSTTPLSLQCSERDPTFMTLQDHENGWVFPIAAELFHLLDCNINPRIVSSNASLPAADNSSFFSFRRTTFPIREIVAYFTHDLVGVRCHGFSEQEGLSGYADREPESADLYYIVYNDTINHSTLVQYQCSASANDTLRLAGENAAYIRSNFQSIQHEMQGSIVNLSAPTVWRSYFDASAQNPSEFNSTRFSHVQYPTGTSVIVETISIRALSARPIIPQAPRLATIVSMIEFPQPNLGLEGIVMTDGERKSGIHHYIEYFQSNLDTYSDGQVAANGASPPLLSFPLGGSPRTPVLRDSKSFFSPRLNTPCGRSSLQGRDENSTASLLMSSASSAILRSVLCEVPTGTVTEETMSPPHPAELVSSLYSTHIPPSPLWVNHTRSTKTMISNAIPAGRLHEFTILKAQFYQLHCRPSRVHKNSTAMHSWGTFHFLFQCPSCADCVGGSWLSVTFVDSSALSQSFLFFLEMLTVGQCFVTLLGGIGAYLLFSKILHPLKNILIHAREHKNVQEESWVNAGTMSNSNDEASADNVPYSSTGGSSNFLQQTMNLSSPSAGPQQQPPSLDMFALGSFHSSTKLNENEFLDALVTHRSTSFMFTEESSSLLALFSSALLPPPRLVEDSPPPLMRIPPGGGVGAEGSSQQLVFTNYSITGPTMSQVDPQQQGPSITNIPLPSPTSIPSTAAGGTQKGNWCCPIDIQVREVEDVIAAYAMMLGGLRRSLSQLTHIPPELQEQYFGQQQQQQQQEQQQSAAVGTSMTADLPQANPEKREVLRNTGLLSIESEGEGGGASFGDVVGQKLAASQFPNMASSPQGGSAQSHPAVIRLYPKQEDVPAAMRLQTSSHSLSQNNNTNNPSANAAPTATILVVSISNLKLKLSSGMEIADPTDTCSHQERFASFENQQRTTPLTAKCFLPLVAILQCITQSGGHIEEFQPNRIVVSFNAETSCPNHDLQALVCATRLQEIVLLITDYLAHHGRRTKLEASTNPLSARSLGSDAQQVSQLASVIEDSAVDLCIHPLLPSAPTTTGMMSSATPSAGTEGKEELTSRRGSTAPTVSSGKSNEPSLLPLYCALHTSSFCRFSVGDDKHITSLTVGAAMEGAKKLALLQFEHHREFPILASMETVSKVLFARNQSSMLGFSLNNSFVDSLQKQESIQLISQHALVAFPCNKVLLQCQAGLCSNINLTTFIVLTPNTNKVVEYFVSGNSISGGGSTTCSSNEPWKLPSSVNIFDLTCQDEKADEEIEMDVVRNALGEYSNTNRPTHPQSIAHEWHRLFFLALRGNTDEARDLLENLRPRCPPALQIALQTLQQRIEAASTVVVSSTPTASPAAAAAAAHRNASYTDGSNNAQLNSSSVRNIFSDAEASAAESRTRRASDVFSPQPVAALAFLVEEHMWEDLAGGAGAEHGEVEDGTVGSSTPRQSVSSLSRRS